jgi:hypothetical protein
MKEYIYIACNVRKHKNTKNVYVYPGITCVFRRKSQPCLSFENFIQRTASRDEFFLRESIFFNVHLLLSVQRRVKSCESESVLAGFRIRIRIGSGFNRASGSGSTGPQKMTHKSRKICKSSCFEVLDGLF